MFSKAATFAESLQAEVERTCFCFFFIPLPDIPRQVRIKPGEGNGRLCCHQRAASGYLTAEEKEEQTSRCVPGRVVT